MDPALLFILASAVLGGFLIVNNSNQTRRDTDLPQVVRANPWSLPDVDPANQAGGFTTALDASIVKASGATGVPFALIKAHGIRESKLDPNAYHFDNNTVGASYGFLQVEWIRGSNRFTKYGLDDSQLGFDGSFLYNPDQNAFLGASIIRDNLNWLRGNLRDTINAYNTGKKESDVEAPNNYVDDVLSYYSTIVGQEVTQ